jgi:Ala-tRNA(Pro) deacylase
MSGTFTKNLLLQDKKGNLFFVTAFEDTAINLKTFHTTVGGHGRVGLARPETMARVLHVEPGTVTPLALMNDTENLVTLVVDSALSDAEQLNFHPMVHTQSIGLTPDQFATFAASCDKTPLVVDLT